MFILSRRLRWRGTYLLMGVLAVVPTLTWGTLASATVSPTWGAQEVAASLNTAHDAMVNSTSCVNSSFCVAGGQYRDSSGTQAFVSTWNGSTWNAQEVAASLNTLNNAQVHSISCVSASFCVAGGIYQNSLGRQAFVSTWNGSTWSDQEIAASLNTGNYAGRPTVSCVSTSFCVAVGSYQATGTQALVSTWNGSTWSDQEIAASLNTQHETKVYSVSCVSASFCVAGGLYRDSPGGVQAFVSTWNGSTWSAQEVAASLDTADEAIVKSVSCINASFCVAGGQYQDSSGTQAFVSTWNGSTWSDQEVAASFNTANSAFIDAVSCVSASLCVAGGQYQDSSGFQAFISTWNGSTWSDQAVAASLNTGNSAFINAVSCVSASFCVAGGGYLDSSGDAQAFVSTWNGSTWGDQEVAASLNTANSLYSPVTSVSCVSSSFCVAGGQYQDSSGTQAFVWSPLALTTTVTTTVSPPSAPSNVVATSYHNGLSTVSWSAPVSDGGSALTGYTVVALDTTTPVNGYEYCQTTTLSCVVSGLTNGDHYDFVVYATNAAGASVSAPSTHVTPAGAPGAPSNLRATSNANGRSIVSWNPPTMSGGVALSNYHVSAIDTTAPRRGGQSCTTTSTSCVVVGLTNGDHYDFVVVATNPAGVGVSSPSALATPRTLASAPRSLRVSRHATDLNFTWRAPAVSGGAPITGYDVLQGPSPTGHFTRLNATTLRSPRFTWHRAHPGTYYVTVQALTLVGTGMHSQPLKVVVK